MPVKPLPSKPDLRHLKHQAKDLLTAHASAEMAAAQRLREFHPRFSEITDADIFAAQLSLGDAQLAIARERGFASWPRLKAHVEKIASPSQLDLPLHEQIDNPVFRQAVRLLDAGDAEGLRLYLKEHPDLSHQRVTFEGRNYFRNPTLLEFIAENPIRHGKLPPNIVAVTSVIVNAGVEQIAVNETLGLISTSRVARECGVQQSLIDLLCDRGADPKSALLMAVAHSEFEAAGALIQHGAVIDLPVAAALGHLDRFSQLLPSAGREARHLALAFAAQFGRTEIVELLLGAGEDPNRYNPVGSHAHSTPLHQAAVAGFDKVVRLLVAHGARLDIKDIHWEGTATDWAEYGGHKDIAEYLRAEIETGGVKA